MSPLIWIKQMNTRLLLTAIAILAFSITACSKPENPIESQNNTKDEKTKSEASQGSEPLGVAGKSKAVNAKSVTLNEQSTKEKQELSVRQRRDLPISSPKPVPPKPVSPERLQELIIKLEEPRPSS